MMVTLSDKFRSGLPLLAMNNLKLRENNATVTRASYMFRAY